MRHDAIVSVMSVLTGATEMEPLPHSSRRHPNTHNHGSLMPTGILRWEDPAPRTPVSTDYEPIAAELRANPGASAVIAEHPDTPDGRRDANRLFNAVKNGYKGFRVSSGGTFRAATRTVTKGDGTKVVLVYAKYVTDTQ
jgi:hypothetical protein